MSTGIGKEQQRKIREACLKFKESVEADWWDEAAASTQVHMPGLRGVR